MARLVLGSNNLLVFVVGLSEDERFEFFGPRFFVSFSITVDNAIIFACMGLRVTQSLSSVRLLNFDSAALINFSGSIFLPVPTFLFLSQQSV